MWRIRRRAKAAVYSLANFNATRTDKLLMGAKNYGLVLKAKDADVIMMTATTFHDQPDIQLTDSTFTIDAQGDRCQPATGAILWGTGELVHYRNADGVGISRPRSTSRRTSIRSRSIR